MRPFYVGGDYEQFPYRPDSVVIDNPPFSLLSKICAFYLERNIRFFMFAPTLTLFGQRSNTMKMTHIVCGNNITYQLLTHHPQTDKLTNFLMYVDGRLEYRTWFFGHHHIDKVVDQKHRALYNDIIEI